MCQAAAAGAVDFARSDPRDPRWWIKLRIVLDQVEDANLVRATAVRKEGIVALLTRPDLTARSLAGLKDSDERLLRRIERLFFPWVDDGDKTSGEREVEALNAMWVEAWGDPNDPETRAAIDRTVAAMRQDLERRQGATRRG